MIENKRNLVFLKMMSKIYDFYKKNGGEKKKYILNKQALYIS